ncbi:unnamed protein product [Camellia sinensis]
MESENLEVAHEFRFFRVYKDGRVEKFAPSTEKIPLSDDPVTGFKCKDVLISSEPEISARIFLPRLSDPTHKLPVLLYIHGGGFSFESAFSQMNDSHVRSLTTEACVIAVSVEYRLAPEHPIPACYEGCWAALRWVATHVSGNGPDPWLNHHADFDRVFVGGDSGGGTISHNLTVRVGSNGLPGVKLVVAILVHPFFGGREDDDEMWMFMCPTNTGLEDPRLKPSAEELGRMGCERVLVLLAEDDHLREVGGAYCEELKKSGWGGKLQIADTKAEKHCFHLENPTSENARSLVQKIATFINLV